MSVTMTPNAPLANGVGSSNSIHRASTPHSRDPMQDYARILYEHTRKQMDTSFGSKHHDEQADSYRSLNRRGTGSTGSSNMSMDRNSL